MMMMSNNMENVAPHVIKNVSRQVGMTWSKTSYLEVAKVVYFLQVWKNFRYLCVWGYSGAQPGAGKDGRDQH